MPNVRYIREIKHPGTQQTVLHQIKPTLANPITLHWSCDTDAAAASTNTDPGEYLNSSLGYLCCLFMWDYVIAY